jgi:hypothetical protein
LKVVDGVVKREEEGRKQRRWTVGWEDEGFDQGRPLKPLDGEERYKETPWAIARLRKSDGAQCVGIVKSLVKCEVSSFSDTRDAKSPGVLVSYR